ncbi:hypothetical protein [Acanthopleuribacter pedis]|uniref:Tetratricopeptide repeat protein n=1 Tax=Acanthopleuribacter pedis TaxID=442870 RepID=A0A8J7U6H6_9BACT|nr:hypothetical protein [Acanthopleuribacter pedis]MBO1322787.1 hypothetical protein [Acanthopleuribacter pedis]
MKLRMLLTFVCLTYSALLCAQDLETRLLHALTENGEQTEFSTLDMALIAGGAKDPDALAAAHSAFETAAQPFSINEKLAKFGGEKAAKALFKSIGKKLKTEDAAQYGILDALKTRAYSTGTMAFLYSYLGDKFGISADDLAVVTKKMGPYFADKSAVKVRESLALLFADKGIALAASDPVAAGRAFAVSSKLFNAGKYLFGAADTNMYNQGLTFYNEGKYREAAELVAGAAGMWPDRKEFSPLAFNIGIKLFEQAEADKNFAAAVPVAERLAPFTGEHKNQFLDTLAKFQYNQAVHLRDNGNLEAALKQAENIERPHSEATIKNFRIGIIENMIEKANEAGDQAATTSWLSKLEGIDAKRAANFKTMLSQMALKALDESGQFDQALELAAKEVGNAVGKQNYLAVLSRAVSSLSDQGKFKEGFAKLALVPTEVEGDDSLVKLREFLYINQLAQYTDRDYKKSLPIFEKAFADKKLKLSDENKAAFKENYGNALFREVEAIIADRKWDLADKKSKQALAKCPNHKLLVDQRKTVETILKRVGN